MSSRKSTSLSKPPHPPYFADITTLGLHTFGVDYSEFSYYIISYY